MAIETTLPGEDSSTLPYVRADTILRSGMIITITACPRVLFVQDLSVDKAIFLLRASLRAVSQRFQSILIDPAFCIITKPDTACGADGNGLQPSIFGIFMCQFQSVGTLHATRGSDKVALFVIIEEGDTTISAGDFTNSPILEFRRRGLPATCVLNPHQAAIFRVTV